MTPTADKTTRAPATNKAAAPVYKVLEYSSPTGPRCWERPVVELRLVARAPTLAAAKRLARRAHATAAPQGRLIAISTPRGDELYAEFGRGPDWREEPMPLFLWQVLASIARYIATVEGLALTPISSPALLLIQQALDPRPA